MCACDLFATRILVSILQERSFQHQGVKRFSSSRSQNQFALSQSSLTSNMSQFSTASFYQQQTMDVSTEMLASAMMLVSLSESAVVHTGYNSRSSFSPPSSANNSGTSLSGWGNTMTRKSYKVDLCSLGSSASQPMEESSSHEDESSVASNTNDSWGFYDM